MTTLALAPTPSQVALVQLEGLRRDLAEGDLELPDILAARDRAAAIRSWASTARLGLSVANEAMEVVLAAERSAGLLLLDITATSGPSTRHYPREAGPPPRMHVPPGTLKELGLRPRDSSRYQLLARLPSAEFMGRVRAIKDADRQLSHAPFLRAANRFATHAGRSTTPTTTRLRRALRLLREICALETTDERKLAHEVISLAAGWQKQLRRHTPTIAERQDVVQRVTSCILCGRTMPPGKPPACTHCGGSWLEA